MKKLKPLAAICCILIIMMSGCSSPVNKGYKYLRSSPVGIAIEYPPSWTCEVDKEEGSAAFVTPAEGLADEYQENVTILSVEIEDTAGAYDEYVIEYMESLPNTVSNYRLVSEENVTIDGKDSYKIVFESSNDETHLRFEQNFIPGDGRVFIYTFIGEPAGYDYFLSYSQKMLNTLRIL